jgi:hypothetical protein
MEFGKKKVTNLLATDLPAHSQQHHLCPCPEVSSRNAVDMNALTELRGLP